MSLFAVALSLLSLVAAQDQRPRAVCSTDSQYQWTFNSLNQSPCEVAGDLLDVCLGRNVYIAALDPGQSYPPAQASGDGNDCRCSTIYYSMLSACAYCQGRSWISWTSQTIPNCAATFDRHFPIPMSSVQVPSWANLDVVSQGAFDATRARDSLNPARPPPPDSTTTPRPVPTTSTPRPVLTSSSSRFSSFSSSSSSSSTSSSQTSTSQGSSTSSVSGDITRTLPGQSTITQTVTDSLTAPTANSTSQASLDDDAIAEPEGEKKKAPIGAIVGGVIGGLFVIATLCSIYFFCFRRDRRVNQSADEFAPTTAAISPFFDDPSYAHGRAISPSTTNQHTGTGTGMFINHSHSNTHDPFFDGSEAMTERTTSPSGVSVNYTNSTNDPPYASAPYQDRSMMKGHHPSPSFATTFSNSNSTTSPAFARDSEFLAPYEQSSTVSGSSSPPFRPVRRVGDDDASSMRTSTRLSRAGYLPPPYDPSTAPPMPMGGGKH